MEYYALIKKVDILIQDWGDGSVVFHGGSGNTHFLNEVTVKVLNLFKDGAVMNEADFFEAIADELDVSNDNDLEVMMGSLLQSFCHLELIERVR